jgi:hypothetical protein
MKIEIEKEKADLGEREAVPEAAEHGEAEAPPLVPEHLGQVSALAEAEAFLVGPTPAQGGGY